MRLGFPQGGPASPMLFWEYANNFLQCINTESVTWKKGKEEDELDSNDGGNIGPYAS